LAEEEGGIDQFSATLTMAHVDELRRRADGGEAVRAKVDKSMVKWVEVYF
jgi:hypothetical protein